MLLNYSDIYGDIIVTFNKNKFIDKSLKKETY